MKSFNRQTVNKIKRYSTPAAIFMILSTVVSGIGTVLKFKHELFPSACARGWIPYDNYCYLDTNLQLAANGALNVCNSYKARLPKTNFRHLKVLSLTYSKHFWVGLKKKDNRWLDISTNKTIDMNSNIDLTKTKGKYDNENSICFVYKMGELKGVICDIVNYIVCVKKFYK
ncbi:C-type lectin-like protein domain [Tanapox virus]|uniref:C-type lectin-like protein domain n=1 Tax=Tanapox virus TaxID=99000 RepID=A7XCQ8_9POXV|nr:C-type lectin-like protein domain [Tanapox virus]ABQ43754.1 C-type lectin-like protein domain [Tanapox virus]